MGDKYETDDTHDIELTDTFVFDLSRIADQVRQKTQERTAQTPEPPQDTTGIRVYPYEKTRVSWPQRVLGWFRRN